MVIDTSPLSYLKWKNSSISLNVRMSNHMDRQQILKSIELTRHPCVEGDGRAPDRLVIQQIIKDVQSLFFPHIFRCDIADCELLNSIEKNLNKEISIAFREINNNLEECNHKGKKVSTSFVEKLPHILDMLNKDIKAIYDGDPAALSYKEIVLCYPGYFAIFSHRIAHELYLKQVPVIPRMISEFAHQKTGIDIHPGAKIGEYFCIDHGTGIVVGETAVIGNRVKLYQGVTIGAKSFEKDEKGNPVKGGKRHPNIGNNVVVYANATILGGDTFIGDGCVVGSNTWVTRSTEPNTLVK